MYKFAYIAGLETDLRVVGYPSTRTAAWVLPNSLKVWLLLWSMNIVLVVLISTNVRFLIYTVQSSLNHDSWCFLFTYWHILLICYIKRRQWKIEKLCLLFTILKNWMHFVKWTIRQFWTIIFGGWLKHVRCVWDTSSCMLILHYSFSWIFYCLWSISIKFYCFISSNQYIYCNFYANFVFILAIANPDVALVTSLRDGMNLVSYEFVACQEKKKGVLILSEVSVEICLCIYVLFFLSIQALLTLSYWMMRE